MNTLMDKDATDRLIERLIDELQAVQTTAPDDGDVLRVLYDGELFPAETFLSVLVRSEIAKSEGSRYKELAHKASVISNEVLCLMAEYPDIRAAFDKYCDMKGEIAGVENFELFAHAFGLGVKLVVAGLTQM